MADSSTHWWQHSVIYQVYPRSFQDSDGDGVGDLPGIASRLPYLQWLGVGAVWISPMYPSPMADFGYDVADYTDVHPLFGTLEDMERLIEEAHALGLRVILDLVPNHSSEQHRWFLESRSSRDNPKRDWYLWRDPAPDGGPPNNWLSVFGGSAWEWDERTGQYYYHAFLKEQPDLNWRNPAVREAMLDAMRFWLDRGVDGFRVDVIWHMIKDEQFRDNPPNPDWTPDRSPYEQLLPVYSADQPEVHEIVAEMRALTDRYQARVLIGEIYLPLHRLVEYYGQDGSGAHLPFNFQLIELPWDAERIFSTIGEYEGLLPEGGWPNWVLGNHDKSRIATRVGPAQARVAALLLLTLRGTPTLYYGDEIGMTDVPIPPEQVQDPWEINVPGLGLGRDPERTPMQWDDSPGAGFSTALPWLPVADDHRTVNVEAQRGDPGSMLEFYRALLALRSREPALHVGSYTPAGIAGDIFAFVREAEGRRFLVAVNLGHEPGVLPADRPDLQGTVVLGTRPARQGERMAGTLELGGDEGVVVALEG
jgi:alpha-glucosidase